MIEVINDVHVEDVHIEAGAYFKAKRDLPYFSDWKAKNGLPAIIAAGTSLLVQDVRYADNVMHTVILRAHPEIVPLLKAQHETLEIRYRVDDFVRMYEVDFDANATRERELLAANQRIAEIQSEMMMLQSNPAEMQHRFLLAQQDAGKMLPAVIMPQSLNIGLDRVETTEIEGLQHKIEAGRQMVAFAADQMTTVAERLSAAVQALAPYYEERAAVSIARVRGALDQANKIMDGVKSLDLWLGTDVEVFRLSSGASAGRNEPLQIFQRVLFSGEEWSRFNVVDNGFDAKKMNKFADALSESMKSDRKLADSILPAQRGIVALAARRDMIDYGDSVMNMMMAEANKERALFIRDGDNAFIVYSPLWGHKMLPELIPSQHQIDAIYNHGEINFRTLSYTDALARHDKVALIYKRLLILLGGLQAREQIFGDLCTEQEAMGFISEKFQRDHMRFVRDNEGLEDAASNSDRRIFDFVGRANAVVKPNSILAVSGNIITPATAPHIAVERTAISRSGIERKRHAKDGLTLCVAKRDLETRSFYTALPTVHGYNYSDDRVLNSKVLLPKGGGNDWDSSCSWLNLDAVDSVDLQQYLDDRSSRRNYEQYTNLFHFALDFVKARELRDAEAITVLSDVAGGRDVIRAWRATHPGSTFTVPIAKKLRNSFLEASCNIEALEIFEGEKVVRAEFDPVSMKPVVYTEKPESERDDRAVPDDEFRRHGETVEDVLLFDPSLDVVWLFDSLARSRYSLTAERKAKMIDFLSENDHLTDLAIAAKSDGTIAGLKPLYDAMNDGSGYYAAVPLGLIVTKGRIRVLCLSDRFANWAEKINAAYHGKTGFRFDKNEDLTLSSSSQINLSAGVIDIPGLRCHTMYSFGDMGYKPDLTSRESLFASMREHFEDEDCRIIFLSDISDATAPDDSLSSGVTP